LQSYSNPLPESEYISHDDEAEAERFANLVGTQGLGEIHVIDDQDVKGYSLMDFGLNVDNR
jgi:hypothetical protein